MGQLHELRLRSNAFIANMDQHIEYSIADSADELIKLNRKQMMSSVNAEDKPLIHLKTGSPYLSKSYARKTGKTKPNLYNSGSFQKEMFLEPRFPEYFIRSFDMYDNFFGVSPENQPEAKKITFANFYERYKKNVLRK
jgi:hypothetical protein